MKTVEFEKSELESTLLTISAVNPENGQLVSGLLKEPLTLATKRKLQKIHKVLLEEYKTFASEIDTVRKECEGDNEKLHTELKTLFGEKITVKIDPIDISSLDNVTTSANYSFDIIEKIAIEKSEKAK